MTTKLYRVLLVSLALVAVSCTEGAKSPEAGPAAKTKLAFTINSWIGWAPLFVAKEKNLFGTADVEISRVEDTAARKATMISGRVDGYASSVDNFALDSAEGVPGKIVMCFDESFGGDGIVSKKSIRSVQDLRGRQVAFQKGLPSHFLLLTVLKKEGMAPSDITQVDLDADKAGAAFTSGKLDAAVTWEPWISKAAEMANGKILVTTRDYPGLIVDTMVFTPAALSTKKTAIQDFVHGWFQALDYMKLHPDESDQIMGKAYSLDPKELKGMSSGVRFYDLARNLEYFGTTPGGPIYGVFDSASDLWMASGVIKTKSASADKIDASFVKAVR